jgi:hypothetical protein
MRMQDIYSIPKKYNKEHKFFEKFLDNDLEKLSKFLELKYSEIEDSKTKGVSPLNSKGPEFWTESGSMSTVKWREYNVFQFHNKELFNLFVGIRDTVKEACEYYGINFEEQQYMVQGWFNINHSKGGKLNWHDHGGPWAPYFHGYYCVSAEPSTTHYKINNDPNRVVDNINLNNRLIVSEMGHPHAMGDWSWDGPRITIAYDISPLSTIMGAQEQHWIPLV